MKIKGWKYYNHGVIPTTAPHRKTNIRPIRDGSIWKIDGGMPLVARWVSNFDCGYETGWWYCIRDGEFDLGALSKSSRKNIRRGLKNVDCRTIDPQKYIDPIYKVYYEAYRNYESADNEMDESTFKKYIGELPSNITWWAAFTKEDDILVGWMTAAEYKDYVEIQIAKFWPEYLKIGISDALYSSILGYYLNEKKVRYISSGSRNINHKTNTQEYKERHFGYRKAYCKLELVYNPKIKPFVFILYPFRKFIKRFDSINIIHSVNAILEMEQYRREYKK